MDTQPASPFICPYFYQEKTMEELKHSLLCTTMELEQTRLAVQVELRKRDDQLNQLRESLSKAMKERDEAHNKYKRLFLEKRVLHQQQQQVSSMEDEPRRGIGSINGGCFSSSDCEESIVSSSPVVVDPIQQQIVRRPEKPLPEKGKLLQAVMKAGPLLQTLLLAGPLPQWRHPPPPLDSFEIPPVTIPSPPQQPPPLNTCGKVNNRKRSLFDGCDSPSETKYQRLVLH